MISHERPVVRVLLGGLLHRLLSSCDVLMHPLSLRESRYLSSLASLTTLRTALSMTSPACMSRSSRRIIAAAVPKLVHCKGT